MRVIAGRFRGRSLVAPRGLTTRPITDRVKETLFNILGHRFGTLGHLPDFDVLDVFAGTGSLGIEALSRGARRCTFVERDYAALRCLRDNLRQLRVLKHCVVRVENAWAMRTPESLHGFGLMFVDPPYRDAAVGLRLVDLLDRLTPALRPDGLLVLRLEANAAFPDERLQGLACVDRRRIGSMSLLFFERKESSVMNQA